MGEQSTVSPALKQAVRRFGASTILVVGDVMVDRYYWGTVDRISPEAPVPVVEVTSETRRLGGAANVAHNICSLGGRAILCGGAGLDLDGEWLLEELGRRSIGSDGIVLSGDVPTTVKTRVVAHNQQVVRFDRERKGMPAAEVRARLDAFLREVWKELDGVVISDYGKGVVSDGLMDRIRSLCSRSRKLPVAVDPKSVHFERYRRTTVITPNFKEAVAAASLKDSGRAGIEEVGALLLRKTRAGAILITRGEEGMSLFEQGQRSFHIPATAREVYDVTGAGDTVIGTLTLALAAGASLREAAYLANAAAGVVVGEFGTVPIRKDQLLRSIPRKLTL